MSIMYSVVVARTRIEYATVYVRAQNITEAEADALKQVKAGGVEYGADDDTETFAIIETHQG